MQSVSECSVSARASAKCAPSERRRRAQRYRTPRPHGQGTATRRYARHAALSLPVQPPNTCCSRSRRRQRHRSRQPVLPGPHRLAHHRRRYLRPPQAPQRGRGRRQLPRLLGWRAGARRGHRPGHGEPSARLTDLYAPTLPRALCMASRSLAAPTITARSAFTAGNTHTHTHPTHTITLTLLATGRGSAGSESPTPSPVPVAVAKAPLPTTAPSLGPGEAAPPTTGSGRVVPPSPLAQQAAAPRTSPQNSSGNLLNAPAGSGRASTAGAQPVTQFQPGLRSSTAGTGASTGTGPSVPLALRGTAIGTSVTLWG